MNWYYADAGKPIGPIPDAEFEQRVRAGKVTPDTLVWREGMARWQPYREVAPSGTADAPPPTTPPPPSATGSPPPPSPAEDLLALGARDYELDIGSCISRSWQLLKSNFWPLIGASVLVLFLMVAWNQLLGLFAQRSMRHLIEGIQHGRIEPLPLGVVLLSSLAGSLLYGIFYGGWYLFYLKLIRGEPVNPGTLFAGFGPSAGTLIVASVVLSVLTMIGLACCILPGIYLSVSWLFTFPLILDKRLGFWAAMELSRQQVTRHWWMMFALAVVSGLIGVAGVIACCLGILVTIPISIGALMYAYEDIFGARPA